MSKKKVVGNLSETAMDMNQFEMWLGISDVLARELIKEPGFPAMLIHGRYRIFGSKAQQWLEEHYPVSAQLEKEKMTVGGKNND